MLSSLRTLVLVTVAAVAVLSSSTDASTSRGLAWGTDNRWAHNFKKGSIDWYHHWQAPKVEEFSGKVEWVPMFWGTKYYSNWRKQKATFAKHKPKYVLAFNEPDVQGQANMSPGAAASLFMKELEPLRKKGIKVSSPQIVWNTKWMDEFMKDLKKKGGNVDFMAVHYYGSFKDPARLQKWVKTIHKKYGKSIWLTEYGVTAQSGGSSKQIQAFQEKVTSWMDRVQYVDRVAWLGCFAVNNPPDAYASRYNAMLTGNGKLRSIGYSYVYKGKNKKRDLSEVEGHSADSAHVARSTPGAKRHALKHHRRIIGLQQAADIVRRNETLSSINGFEATPEDIQEYLNHVDDDDEENHEEDPNAEHCDELCKLRDELTEGTELDDDDKLD